MSRIAARADIIQPWRVMPMLGSSNVNAAAPAKDPMILASAAIRSAVTAATAWPSAQDPK